MKKDETTRFYPGEPEPILKKIEISRNDLETKSDLKIAKIGSGNVTVLATPENSAIAPSEFN